MEYIFKSRHAALLIFLVGLNYLSLAQHINIKVFDDNIPIKRILVSFPYGGYEGDLSGEFLSKEYEMDSLSGLSLNLSEHGSGLYRFRTARTRFNVILFPRDTITLTVYLSGVDMKVGVAGTNAAGHLEWLKINQVKLLWDIVDTLEKGPMTVNQSVALTKQVIDEKQSIFKKLWLEGKISDEYYNASTTWLKSHLSYAMFTFYTDRGNRDIIRPAALELIEEILQGPEESRIFGSHLMREVNEFEYYDDTTAAKHSLKELPHHFQSIYFIPEIGKNHERMLAQRINSYAIHGYDGDWKKAFDFFKKKYAQSSFIPLLDSLLAPFYTTTEFTGKVIFENKYTSLSDLVKNIEGSYVFVDLWATWCMPCRFEMRKIILDPLSVALEKKGVKKLYLSIDDSRRHDLWLKTIDLLKLDGYHHRVGEDMYKELQSLVYGGDAFSIPRYLLIDGSGRVLDNDLPRPSSLKELLGLIDELIK